MRIFFCRRVILLYTHRKPFLEYHIEHRLIFFLCIPHELSEGKVFFVYPSDFIPISENMFLYFCIPSPGKYCTCTVNKEKCFWI